MSEAESSKAAELAQALHAALAAEGFYAWGFLSSKELFDVLAKMGTSKQTENRYGLDSVGAVAVVALRYGEIKAVNPALGRAHGDGDVSLSIGRFARANWYAELLKRLERASVAFAQKGGLGIPSGSWRRLVNSGLPEKPLAIAAGLGSIGKNGILISRKTALGKNETSASYQGPGMSSAVVLGLLLLPQGIRIESEAHDTQTTPSPCGACSRCIEACPTRALADRGYETAGIDHATQFDRSRCIQHWASTEGLLPPVVEQAWGCRLYGCDTCLEACPHFKPDLDATTEFGRIGASVSARWLLESDDGALDRALKGTTLDRSWISKAALRRSALVALESTTCE